MTIDSVTSLRAMYMSGRPDGAELAMQLTEFCRSATSRAKPFVFVSVSGSNYRFRLLPHGRQY